MLRGCLRAQLGGEKPWPRLAEAPHGVRRPGVAVGRYGGWQEASRVAIQSGVTSQGPRGDACLHALSQGLPPTAHTLKHTLRSAPFAAWTCTRQVKGPCGLLQVLRRAADATATGLHVGVALSTGHWKRRPRGKAGLAGEGHPAPDAADQPGALLAIDPVPKEPLRAEDQLLQPETKQPRHLRNAGAPQVEGLDVHDLLQDELFVIL